MGLKCLFGHKWDGCTCTACGKTRDERHDYSKDCEKCFRCGKTVYGVHDWSKGCEKCARCGAERKDTHKWDGCNCKVCGATRHDWSKDCEQCASCGSKRSGSHKWNECKCKACGKTRKYDCGKYVNISTYDLCDLPANVFGEVIISCDGLANMQIDLSTVGYDSRLIHVAANEGKAEHIRYLVKAGNHINARNQQGCTPLHFAANGARVAACRILIEMGADVNAIITNATRRRLDCLPAANADTPLHLAVRCCYRVRHLGDEAWALPIEVISLLLANGARTNIKNEEGHTALSLASDMKLTGTEVIQLLS